MFKLMTLNLNRYHNWKARQAHIISLTDQQAPDVIAMQEVLTNPAFSTKPQSDFIADECGYAYRAFAPTLLRMNARDQQGDRTQQASEGQAIISKYPIVSSESYYLRQYTEYPEDVSVQFVTIQLTNQPIELCNVHFANNDVAYLHLDELLEVITQRKSAPIILGDFNIYKLAEYKQRSQALQFYQLSSEASDYVSYEPDGESLDYIAVPDSRYRISDVLCPNDYVSDHRALLSTISATVS